MYCISDLHTDHKENMEWVKNITGDKEGCLIVAGDVSHMASQFETTMACLTQKYASVHFVPGNHGTDTQQQQQSLLLPLYTHPHR